MATKKEIKNGYSTTSLVLSIVWALFCLTIIGAIFWIRLSIAALILGIVALVKKQKKWTALAWVIISGLVLLVSTTILIVGFIFVKNNADVLVNPIMELSEIIKNDPELAKLIDNPEFANEFEYMFKSRLIENFGTGEIDEEQDILSVFPLMLDEMKDVMLELKDKYKTE